MKDLVKWISAICLLFSVAFLLNEMADIAIYCICLAVFNLVMYNHEKTEE